MTTYRTTDLTKWGVGTGANLTPTQVDVNFWGFEQRIAALEALPSPGADIDDFNIVGRLLYVILTDSTVKGPYVLPVAKYIARGNWTPFTVYAEMDTFIANGNLYEAIFPHTSASSFDPGANDGLGHDYYSLLLEPPGNSLPTGGATGQILTKSTSDNYAVTWSWKTPDDGTLGQVIVKQSSTQDDTAWEFLDAIYVTFTPVTGSPLGDSDTVAEALEDIVTGGAMLAENVVFTPPSGSGLTSSNVSDALVEVASGSGTGKQTIWVPAAGMSPLLTSGAELNAVEVGIVLVKTMNFDPDTSEACQFEVAMPKSWDKGAVSFRVFWSHSTASTNFGVTWQVYGNGAIDAQELDINLGHVELIAAGGTEDTLYITGVSDPLELNDWNGDPMTDPGLIVFQVWRIATDATNDTLDADARLQGIQIYYNTNTATDD